MDMSPWRYALNVIGRRNAAADAEECREREAKKKNLEGERTERVETATAKSLEMKRREGEGVLRRKGKLTYFRRSVNRV